MSLYYQLVFVLLVLEIFLFLVMLLPLPIAWRSFLLSRISKSRLVDRFLYVLRILFVFVLILFFDSLQKVFNTQKQPAKTAEADAVMHAKMFHAQRNMYLTGSVIFLSLVLDRFYHLMLDLVKHQEHTEQLKQQAAKTTREYLKLLDAEEQSKLKLDTLKQDSDNVQKLKKELEIVKKQAQQTNDEYMKLTDKYVALEQELEGRKEAKKDK